MGQRVYLFSKLNFLNVVGVAKVSFKGADFELNKYDPKPNELIMSKLNFV
jgi:hypothetical protein